MPENTTSLTPQEVIVGLAKAIGMQVPDTYSAAFGTSVMDTLTDRLNAHKAAQPMVMTLEYINQNAMNALAAEVAQNLGIEQGLAATMVSNSGNAVASLNASATPVSLSGNPTSTVDPESNSGGDGATTRTRTVTEPDRDVSQALRNDIKLVQETFTGAIGRTNQMRTGITGPLLGLDSPLRNISGTSDAWDQSSLSAVNAVIDLLKERNNLSGQFPDSGYTPALGQAIQDKIDELKNAKLWEDPLAGQKLAALNQILPEAQRNQVFAALDRLHAANELRPVAMVERQITETIPGSGGDNVSDNNNNDTNDNNESGATPLDPNNADHAPVISARDSIAGFAKFAGVAVPAQYTSDYGQAVISGLNSKFDAFKTARGGEWDATAQDAWIVHVTEGMGLEVNDANKQLVIDGLSAREVSVASLDKALTDGLSVTQTAWSPVSNNSGGNPNPNPNPNSNAGVTDFEKSTAIATVEGVLFQLGGSLDKMPGIGGMISQFGLTDTIITPLEQGEIGGDFGTNSQDLASKLIMGLKMINGDKNADGTYSNAIGQDLRLAILTKPEFGFVRDQIKAADGTPLRLFSGGGGALTGASAEDQQQLARTLLTFDETEPTAPGADATDAEKAEYQALMQRRAEFAQTHAKDLESVRQLNAFFKSMDLLQQEGIYNNEKARQTNQNNLMLDAASGLLDQWAPGVKAWLQDFFTNSQFGQMISGIMSQFFGINVGRLWGDKDDAAALERSKPLIENSFADYYNAAKQELEADGNTPTHAEIIAKSSETIMAKMDNGAFKAAMGIIFKGQDKDVIEQAVTDALQAAQNSTDLESAQQAFSQSLLESGNKFRNGQELSAEEQNDLETHLRETSREIQAAAGVALPGSDVQNNNDNSDNLDVETDDNDGSQLGSSEVIRDVVSPDGQDRERQTDAPAVDAEVIDAGDKNVELIYKPHNGPDHDGTHERFSHGRVDDIQFVLGNNAEALGLSLNADGMKNKDGVYTDTLTPYTNAVIEETLIRAQIHELQEQNIVITQAHLDEIEKNSKLTLENLDTVTTYLQDKGVSAADVAKFSEAVIGADGAGIGTDYYSTSNTSRTAGPRQEHTVLEQSHFGNQFDLKLAQWVPDAAPVETDLTGDDPLRDQYLEHNKDRPCEIPYFFKDGTGVAAIIRDKNGDDDPSNDTFKRLDFDLYLSTHRIQDGDAEDLKALLDNYNWENPTEKGVQDVINKVLGIEPFVRDRNMTVDANRRNAPEEVVLPDISQRAVQQEHKRPEAIRDLRMLREDQAEFLEKGLGLQNNRDVMRMAERDIMSPLEVFVDRQLRRTGSDNGVVFIELEAHDLKHPDFDVALAYRNERGNLEFRFIDYDTDAIIPIPDQRAGNTDIAGRFDPQRHDHGARRLDDFIDEMSRNHVTGQRIQGPSDGYQGIGAIVPDGDGNLKLINGFQAVYGEAMMRNRLQEYQAATSERYAHRTAYERNQRASAEHNGGTSTPRVNGIPLEEKNRLDELARSGNVGAYNNASGSDDPRQHAGLSQKTYNIMPSWFRGAPTAFAWQIDRARGIFDRNIFEGNNYTMEDFSQEDQDRARQIFEQQRDMRIEAHGLPAKEPDEELVNDPNGPNR